jgi:hydroxymethylpyrimidine/phosphomethylpyrimidine kinase
MNGAGERKVRVGLTIAGSDPSGGAGIQADLKTFHQFDVYGASVITLLTVQNSRGVQEVQILEPRFVVAQLRAVLDDIRPHAAKTGALGNEAVIRAVAAAAADFEFPLVVDPVMLSKHGAPLIAPAAQSALTGDLLPRAFLVTPNLHEAAALSGIAVTGLPTMEEAARRIADFGVPAVLVKGGHLEGEPVDLLYWKGERFTYPAERVETRHTHGTGCTYSAAITAGLARGESLPEAVSVAKKYITRAIRTNPGLGSGFGPVNHRAAVRE